MDKNKLKDILKWLAPAIVVCWVIVVIYAQHFAIVGETVTGPNQLSLALERMKAHPFDIFPLDMSAFWVATYIIFLGCLLLYVEYLRRKRLRTANEHGSAAWNVDKKKYNKVFSAPKGKPFADRSGGDPHDWEKRNKNIILSNDVFLSMDGRATRRTLNSLVIGGSGSGKSRFLAKPNILQANCSFVITDPKGELLESMGGFLRRRGYKIKVFNLVEMDHSHSYNPFQYIRNEEGVLTMINALIENTTPPGSNKGDPFWGATRS